MTVALALQALSLGGAQHAVIILGGIFAIWDS